MNYIETTPMAVSALAISRLTQQVRAPKTILVVEDEAFIREMIYEILEAAGYRVLKCANAKQAQAVFRQYGDIIDLLVTDLVLPGQSGHELAQDLLQLDSELKVILISGYPGSMPPEKDPFRNQVFHLPKPFSSESLVRKVWQVTSAVVGEIAI